MNHRLQQQINFYLEADKLKTVVRRNFLADGSRRENTAEHSWHLVVLGFTFLECWKGTPLKVEKLIQMLALHDLVEIDAGDTFLFDAKGYEDKEQREQAAAHRLFGLLPPDLALSFREAWEEFESGDSPEATFARGLDRLSPFLLNLRNGGQSWKEAGITRDQILTKFQPVKAASLELWELVETLSLEAQLRGELG